MNILVNKPVGCVDHMDKCISSVQFMLELNIELPQTVQKINGSLQHDLHYNL